MMRCKGLLLWVPLAISLTTCIERSREEPLDLKSPSSEFTVRVYESEFTDFTHLAGIVYFDLRNDRGQTIASERTRASTVSKWSVGWVPRQDTIIFNSRDIGVLAWSCSALGFVPVETNDEIMAVADSIHVMKYGQ